MTRSALVTSSSSSGVTTLLFLLSLVTWSGFGWTGQLGSLATDSHTHTATHINVCTHTSHIQTSPVPALVYSQRAPLSRGVRHKMTKKCWITSEVVFVLKNNITLSRCSCFLCNDDTFSVTESGNQRERIRGQ